MIIELNKMNKLTKNWSADCIDLSGSPIIGIGKTKYEALVDLYINLLFHHRNNLNIDYSFFELRENGKVINRVNIL